MVLRFVLERFRTCLRRSNPCRVLNEPTRSDDARAELLREECTESAEHLSPGTVVCIRPATNSLRFLNHVGRIQQIMPDGQVRIAAHGAIWEKSGRSEILTVHVSEVRRLSKPTCKFDGRRRVTLGDCSYPKAVAVGLIGESGWGLLDSIAGHVVDYLVSVPIDSSAVLVSGCSSSRGDFSLTEALSDNARTWWISGAGTMPRGIGNEWLQFSFPCVGCVRFMGIKIPPLPQGPLSVRDFHVLSRRTDMEGLKLADDSEDAWQLASPLNLQTLDTARMQEFVFEPAIETNKVRLVCTKTAAAGSMSGMFGADCVGLFQVQFA